MPTHRSVPAPESSEAPHRARDMAESFGADPERYDRIRPRYPDALIEHVVGGAPGPDLLDVGTGTGIAARQFQAAGCTVLGVDTDARMAAFARTRGLSVDVAPFETWDAAGRTFDAVVAAQTWHWIDPVAGPAKAARVLRPGGRLALFWNVFRPTSEIAEALGAAYRRALPDAPRDPWTRPALDAYGTVFARTAESLRVTGDFEEPDDQRFEWERAYTRDAWLEMLRTTGETGRHTPRQTEELIARTGAALDALGGTFTMPYTAVLITATRTGAD
ncbi:class I SAM-dependent methyltransferase [Streptomyces sp. cg35]|uniref:class I SAM-dependent methyltransferase n=1 Tax=Streptomyces sp. cg35 TaxID=3421650 RepID=UPI003D16CAF0